MFVKRIREILSHLDESDVELIAKKLHAVIVMICRTYRIPEELMSEHIDQERLTELLGMLVPAGGPLKSGTSRGEWLEKSLLAVKKTIEVCTGKFMPNNRNVLGVAPGRIKDHPCFQEDKSHFRLHGFMKYGVYEGDVYNTIVSDMYLNIREVKWLLYERGLVPFEQVVQQVFLSETRPSFGAVVANLHAQNAVAGFPWSLAFDAVKYAIIFLENYHAYYLPPGYRKITLSVKRTRLDKESKDDREAAENDIRKIHLQPVVDSLRAIGEDIFLQYLQNALQHLRHSWYGNVPHVLWFQAEGERGLLQGWRFPITRKLVYSFAKSFAHKSREKWEPLLPLWDMLDRNTQSEMKVRLLHPTESTKWFNVSGHLRRRNAINAEQMASFKTAWRESITVDSEGNLMSANPEIEEELSALGGAAKKKSITSNLYLIANVRVFGAILQRVPEIVYQALAYKGTLSRVVLSGAEESAEAHSFFARLANKDLPGHDLPERRDAFTRHTIDFIPQLALFHRFLHTRIAFLSAATGTGKSTQIPKLLLYATGALLYKGQGRVVCTQPRIAPTTETAERVSKELGIPIPGPCQAIQYAHSDGAYLPQGPYATPFLRIVTDGILLEAISDSQHLLETYEITPGEKALTGRSLWDVVVIDEAHEHNRNMDLILSLMKEVMQVNLMVTLVVMSATMEADVKRYRQFFSAVGDSPKVPWFTGEPFSTSTGDQFLVVVDRRVHLGLTTNKPIKDVYMLEDPTFEEAERLAVEKALTLTDGDALLFSVGEANIRRIVDTLNQQLTAGVVALPYYSTLPSSFQSIISTGLQKNLKRIKFDRRDLFQVLDEHGEDWETRAASSHAYSRAVVVATNMAEASITIDSLRYVIDTGYAKKPHFDVGLGGDTLSVTMISESSRLQRRGRVGRRAPGTVFYMYKEFGRVGVEEMYSMTHDNVYETLLPLVVRQESPAGVVSLDEELRKIYFDCSVQVPTRPTSVRDEKGEFYLLHPEEHFLVRDEEGGAILPSSPHPDRWRISYVDKVYKGISVLERLLCNGRHLASIRGFLKTVGLPQLGLGNAVSIIVAASSGRVLEAVIEYLVRVKVKNERDPVVEVDNRTTLASPPVIDESVPLTKLPVEALLGLILQAFREAGLPGVTQPFCLNPRELFYYALYFSNPLSLATRQGNNWVNAFSGLGLDVEGDVVDHAAFGYFSINGTQPRSLLPMNNLCFKYITDGHRDMGAFRMVIHS